MKPFNLEEALSGKPIQTRNGHKVTLLPNFRSNIDSHPLRAIIHFKTYDTIESFTSTGRFVDQDLKSRKDLFMVAKTKEMWVNIYSDYTAYAYPTKKCADMGAGSARLGCIKFEYGE